MNAEPGEVFRVPLLPWIGVLMTVAAPVLIPAWLDTGLFLGVLSVMVVVTLYSLWLLEVVVRDEGIVMYRLNRLTWPEIESARVRRVVGLPYLHIRRRHGMSWWLPLYFRGDRDIRLALSERAPEAHPIPVSLKQVP